MLTWTAYFESQPRADGSVQRGAVSIHLRDLPGRRGDGRGGYTGADIDFDLPLRFAEEVIAGDGALALALLERLPRDVPRPELVARVQRLEPRSNAAAGTRRVTAEVRVSNAGTAPSGVETHAAIYLRPRADDDFSPLAEAAAQQIAVPPLAPGESIGLLFDTLVPAHAAYLFLALDPGDVVRESTETAGSAAGKDVQWERLRFPSVNYRSIGVRREALDAGDGIVRRAVSTAGSAVVRFEGTGELPSSVGRGDRLVLAPARGGEVVAHVAAREGANRLRLQRPLEVSLPAARFVVRRAFNDIQSWETARQGDLVADERIEVGVLYADGPFRCRPVAESGCRVEGGELSSLATIDGSLTNAAHFMALTAADGQPHGASAGAGVVLDGEGMVRVGIRVRDDYTRIEGMELRGFGPGANAAAVSIERARHVRIERLLIHDFGAGDSTTAGVRAGVLGDFTLRNTIMHDGGTGVHVDRANASGAVENCTVLAMSGWGFREDAGLLDVRNSIAMANGEGDIQVARGVQAYNMSSDETAAGPGAMTARQPERQFRSVANGARDLHLRADAEASGAGARLFPAFATDVDGERRPVGVGQSWSVGADQ